MPSSDAQRCRKRKKQKESEGTMKAIGFLLWLPSFCSIQHEKSLRTDGQDTKDGNWPRCMGGWWDLRLASCLRGDETILEPTSSKSPLTPLTSGAIERRYSQVSRSQTFPVQTIWPILPGTSSFLNLTGRSWVRRGIWRSPMVKSSTEFFKAEWFQSWR